MVILYDDSDGWYDHVVGPILSQSNVPTTDALTDTGVCGTATAQASVPRFTEDNWNLGRLGNPIHPSTGQEVR